VTNKHRIQMIDHFTDQIKYSKSCRCDAISTNIFASLLAGLKALSDTKSTIGHEEIKTTTATLITVIYFIFLNKLLYYYKNCILCSVLFRYVNN